MRAIDADALKKEFPKDTDWEYPVNTHCHVCEIIDSQPTIEPERKTGKWIYKNDLKQFFCSECGFPSLTYDDTYIYSMDLPNYCEDCGADMRTAKHGTKIDLCIMDEVEGRT